jgi:hypothetical protein
VKEVLLSTTYFGPIQWYQKLYRAEEVFIERCESFQKQTYRNRCLIATTNGLQALTIPVVRDQSNRLSDTNQDQEPISLIHSIRISDHGNWRHLHWNALKSAYGESPFFDYYQDDIRPFFEQCWDYLFDFNEAIREKMCELLDIQPKVSYTEEFASTVNNITDFRSSINPKHPEPDPDFTPKRYYQVYEQKHGFLPNLSILDLLFNMGPESIFYL